MQRTYRRIATCAAALLATAWFGTASPALAQASAGSDVCTTFTERAADMAAERAQNCPAGQNCNQGILSEIYIYVKDIVEGASQKLFFAFVDSEAYQSAVNGAIVLMIAIFGIAFTIGVVQASFGQILIRLVKLGIIFTLISPGGWEFFNDTMVRFFTDGTDDLVKGVMQIGMGSDQPLPADATPFYQLDNLAEFIVNPETIALVLGAFAKGGPFGALMAGMSIVTTYGFIVLMLRALQNYAIALVVRTLLLGMAPIFFTFLLFDRTKTLFTGWLNAIISFALRPILLFTFLAFFLVLIQTAARDMFSAELCWTSGSAVQGADNKPQFWHFKDPQTGEIIDSQMTWGGSVDCLLKGSGQCPEFPINILDMLSFLILVFLATRFVETIDSIANELSNAFVSLDTQGKLAQFFQEQTSGAGNFLSGGFGNKPAASPRRGAN